MQEGSSFNETNSVQQIPLTRAALEEHVKKAVDQGGYIWGKTLCCHHQLKGGGGKTEGINEPHWTTLPQATKSCHELVSCGCKSGCKTVLQVQEGCISVHRSLLLWGRMCQLTLRSLIYSDIKVPRNDPWEVVKLSRDHDVLMNN